MLIEVLKSDKKSTLTYALAFLYSTIGFNKVIIKGKNNKIILKNNFLKRCKITIIGTNNEINLSDGLNWLDHTTIYIYGNNNRIKLGYRNNIIEGDLYIEDDNGLIEFGNHTQLMGKTHIAVIEGTEVIFGNECMFSSEVVFRTGDSHSIIDNETKQRINPSKSIHVADHVWFGNKTTILKGVDIPKDVIIGTGALVSKSIISPNVIVAGHPAKIIKQGINWELYRKRI